MTRRIRLISLLSTLCITTAGCSFNEFGVVKKGVIHTSGATIEQVTAPGLHISMHPALLNVSIGHTRSVRIFASACRAPEALPELVYQRVMGASIVFESRGASATIGLRESLRPRRIGRNDAISRRIHFEPDDLGATVLELQGLDCLGDGID